jgi:GTP-binding protein HflX
LKNAIGSRDTLRETRSSESREAAHGKDHSAPRTATRAIVVGVGLKDESIADIKNSLAELEELALSANLVLAGHAVQILNAYNAATLIGRGKVEEIKNFIIESKANVVIVDHHLSGVQGRNLEQDLGVRVLDRSQLILEIFSQRATTHEGKLQVELARMLDQMPRMVGAWQGSLSRLGGGIGTRGPGETALEADRRRIRNRIKQIKKQLESVHQSRSQHRALRKKQQVPSFALIGYTNTGKSTLLNRMTQSHVLAKDQMFATLDPTTRKVHLGDIGRAVMTDTVGFIRDLPTHLVEAFKATLEETSHADILIHVVDLSSPHRELQEKEVLKLIEGFGWSGKPMITVYNKVDQAPFDRQFQVHTFPRVFLSAKTGEGVEKLKRLMAEAMVSLDRDVELYFPRNEEHRIYELGRDSQIRKTESNSQGTVCFVSMSNDKLARWRPYIVK